MASSRFWVWNRYACPLAFIGSFPAPLGTSLAQIFPAPFIHTNHTKPNTSRRQQQLNTNRGKWSEKRAGEGPELCSGFPLSASSRLNITGKIPAKKQRLSIRNKGSKKARGGQKRKQKLTWLQAQVATDAASSRGKTRAGNQVGTARNFTLKICKDNIYNII